MAALLMFPRLPRSARRPRLTQLLPLCCLLLLAGCKTGDSILSPDTGVLTGPACPVDAPQPDKDAVKSKAPPAPRTLPEALHVYLHCLCSPKPPAGQEGQNGNDSAGEDKGKDKSPPASGNNSDKSPPANGDKAKTTSRQGNADKDKDKPSSAGGDKGKDKSPPAAGEKNGEEKKDGDKDKEDKDKEKDKDKEDKDKDKEDKDKDKDKEATDSWYSAHAQATVITQSHDTFRAPYAGPNSLLRNEPWVTSETSTLFLDTRLCEGVELVFNPEIAGGRGFSNVMGIAGFPNGEITRVGALEPTPYIARLFVRTTWEMGGEQEKIEDAPNQIAGKQDIDRLTLVAGKMSATDLVDNNRYSHDPRTQFLNWSLMYNGAWDYPANVRGYSYGIGLDYNQKDWALRYGIFAEPAFANGAPLDPHFLKANGQFLELEERYQVCEHPGHLRLLSYLNHANMGKYSQAIDEMPVNPDITQTRNYRFKYGCGASWDQEITKDFGVWARLGWNDGHTETWAFTEIDETAALGMVLRGRLWCRPNDQVGVGVVCNGLSPEHRDYLAAGGVGFIIGDGQLNYGLEEILETYYNLEIHKGINATVDFQEVNHPAYNRDRGPVAIVAVRVHFEF